MMTRLPHRRPSRALASLAGVLLSLALPLAVMAHAELATSDPAEGTTVQAPFAGPVVMTFTEAIAGESRAGMTSGADKIAAATTVAGRTMTLAPEAALAEGEYEVRWTSVANDGHIERGTFRFTVAAAATPGPTPTPGQAESHAPSTAPASSAPAPVPLGGTDATPAASSGGDVIVPIVVGALLVAALAAFMLRRRDATSNSS